MRSRAEGAMRRPFDVRGTARAGLLALPLICTSTISAEAALLSKDLAGVAASFFGCDVPVSVVVSSSLPGLPGVLVEPPHAKSRTKGRNLQPARIMIDCVAGFVPVHRVTRV